MAVSLEARLNAFNFPNQLQAVKNLLDNGRGSVSFWGTRLIEVAGNEGSVSLGEIASKITRASSQRLEANDLTVQERIAGLDIVRKLLSLYQETDAQINGLNFLTRFFVWIREFRFDSFTPRFFLNEAGVEFRTYSEEAVIQNFGGAFDGQYNHPARDRFNGSFNEPSQGRVVVLENRIRSQSLPA